MAGEWSRHCKPILHSDIKSSTRLLWAKKKSCTFRKNRKKIQINLCFSRLILDVDCGMNDGTHNNTKFRWTKRTLCIPFYFIFCLFASLILRLSNLLHVFQFFADAFMCFCFSLALSLSFLPSKIIWWAISCIFSNVLAIVVLTKGRQFETCLLFISCLMLYVICNIFNSTFDGTAAVLSLPFSFAMAADIGVFCNDYGCICSAATLLNYIIYSVFFPLATFQYACYTFLLTDYRCSFVGLLGFFHRFCCQSTRIHLCACVNVNVWCAFHADAAKHRFGSLFHHYKAFQLYSNGFAVIFCVWSRLCISYQFLSSELWSITTHSTFEASNE